MTNCRQIALFFLLAPGTPWFLSTIRLPDGDEEAQEGSGPTVTFRGVGNPDEVDSLREEVDRLNNDSKLALMVEGGRVVRPSPLIQESGVWERE